MTVQTKSLGVEVPATPICGVLNNYCGVTLAQAVESTADDAATNARDTAKRVAQEALNRAAGRDCPAICGNSPANSGDTEPKLKAFGQDVYVLGPFEDPLAGKFVAYAVAYWEREANCVGNPGQLVDLTAGSWSEVFHYAPGDPECDKKRLYTGCVISKAIDRNATRAKDKADAAALGDANRLQREDRAKQCPVGCRPGELDPDPEPALTAQRIFTVHLFQMKQKPYASFAVAHFSATIKCPPIVEEEEEEEGGGGEFMGREPAPERRDR